MFPRRLFCVLPLIAALSFSWVGAAPPDSTTELGAVPVTNGVSFRVWAPNATAVNVRGEFNAWGLSHPLASEGANGRWSIVVPNAQPGQAYKFFITNTAENPATVWRRDPYSRVINQVSASDSNSIIYNDESFVWGNAAPFVPPPLERLVLYELHIGSFNAAGIATGTFTQAIARLDYLASLGINAVQVMPVHESPGAGRWGYDTTLPLAVDVELGGPNGFKSFVSACHQRGLAVIVDVVYNHAWSDGNDMWEFDLWSEQDGGGIWFYNDAIHRDSPWGPRYDYTRPEVQAYVLQGLRDYLDDYRVDGFRFDATGIMRLGDGGDVPGAKAMLQACTQMMRTEYPGKILIAEDFQGDFLASRPVASGGLGFDTEWSDFFADVVRFLIASDATRDLAAMASGLTETFNGDAFRRIIYIESHDTAAPEDPPFQTFPYRGAYLPRRLNQVDGASNLTTCKLVMLGHVLNFTAPGVPMLFQGQEAYHTGVFQYPVPSRVPWDTLLPAREGIRQLHDDLIALRTGRDGVSAGLQGRVTNVFHRNDGAKVMAYLRRDAGGPGDDTVVVMNASATDFSLGYLIGMPAPGTWIVRFHSDLTTYDARFTTAPGSMTSISAEPVAHDGMPARLTLPRLAPYSALILSQDPNRSGISIR